MDGDAIVVKECQCFDLIVDIVGNKVLSDSFCEQTLVPSIHILLPFIKCMKY